MKNNNYIKEKIKELKKDTRPIDGSLLLKLLIDSKDKLTNEERNVILRCVTKLNTVSGEKLLMRAFYEKVITEAEWKDYQLLGFDLLDMCPILQAYFIRKDGKRKEKAIVISTVDSITYIHKKILIKKFDIEIKTIKEATVEMIKNISKIKRLEK